MPARMAEETIEATDSGVAWTAIIGGAVAAAGLSIMLAPLGAAFGLSSDSPWRHVDTDDTFTITAAIWVIVVQWLSSGLGGYLTGRMRTKWAGAHTHEVFFRDTAHGFLAWSLASVGAAIMLIISTTHAIKTGNAPTHPELSPTVLMMYSLSLFIGAFIASAAAALGGMHRDEHYEIGWGRK